MSRGVDVVSLKEARDHLAILLDDPRDIPHVIAAYDHLDDVIVFNPDHLAWFDMRSFMKEQKEKGVYSTAHPHHIVRHELGHAEHYRALSPQERGRIWFAADMGPDEVRIARRVSDRAVWNPKEFVAEVFAGLWAGVDYDEQVATLFEVYGGPEP